MISDFTDSEKPYLIFCVVEIIVLISMFFMTMKYFKEIQEEMPFGFNLVRKPRTSFEPI